MKQKYSNGCLLQSFIAGCSLSTIECNDNDLDEEKNCNDSVYTDYNFDHRQFNELPIMSYRDKILKTINENSVVILQGATGCGKTTQVSHNLKEKVMIGGCFFFFSA